MRRWMEMLPLCCRREGMQEPVSPLPPTVAEAPAAPAASVQVML